MRQIYMGTDARNLRFGEKNKKLPHHEDMGVFERVIL